MNHVYGALELVVSVLRRHRHCRGYYYYIIMFIVSVNNAAYFRLSLQHTESS